MAALRTGVFPGVTPRLIRADDGRASGSGGLSAEALIDAVAASGLRGRGGAAFPLARKLAAVAAGPGPRVVLVNGEEGEPASVKDRWLLRTRPHLVLDGALLAARAVGARDVYVYVSDAAAAASLQAALAGRDDAGRDGAGPSITVVRTEPSYVAGEETAAVNAVNGKPAKPSDKPPRPFTEGVGGRPTLVSNAETIANLPAITRQAARGEEPSAGTFLLTLGGAVPRPGLYEVPFGVSVGEAAAVLGGFDNSNKRVPRGYVMGGYFAGLLNERGAGLPLDYDALRAAGSGLGCGAVTVLGDGDCPVGAAALLLSYFGRENAGQCGACFNGTAAMAGVAVALARGEAGADALRRLGHWSGFLPGRGACATLDGAAGIAATLLREFPDAVQAHLTRSEPICAATDFLSPAAPFAADPDPITPRAGIPAANGTRRPEAVS